jgi:membrane fusion protein, heavy metal efflux system
MKLRATLLPFVLLAALTACRQQRPTTAAPQDVPQNEPGVVSVPPDSPKLKRIRVQPVEVRQFVTDEVIVPGRVETNPNRISRVAVPVGGRIVKVYVRLGDAVTQNQPLLAVDSVEAGTAIAAWRQSQSQARTAASALGKADSDLTRLKELHAHKAAALKDVIAAQNDFTQAQSAVEQAKTANEEAVHRLALLGIDLNAPSAIVTVKSPIAGKVLDIAVVQGEFRNDTNAPLMTVADLSSVWIAGDVPESAIRLVQVGEPLEVSLSAYPDRKFRARVMRINDVVDPQSRTIKVHAEIENPAGALRPEMFGQIRHFHGSKPFPAVPASAVVQLQGRNVVWVTQSAGVFRQTPVVTGPRQNDIIAVTSGVNSGDRIVVDGATLLEPLK